MTRAFQKPLGVLAYYWSEGDDSDLKLFENELSVFIDESGDFGETRDIRDYYVTFVFHDQNEDISENTRRLENSVKESGLDIGRLT